MKISALDFHDRLIREKGIEKASGFSDHGREARFKIIQRCLKQIPGYPNIRILDYGCYDGGLFDHLSHVYMGIDINPKFIAYARKRLREHIRSGMVTLKVGNILDLATQKAVIKFRPHVAVASGVFCLKGESQKFKEIALALFTLAKRAFICNMLTADTSSFYLVDTPGIIRWTMTDALKLLDYCICPSWEIIRSYLQNDMTIFMRKEWTDFR